MSEAAKTADAAPAEEPQKPEQPAKPEGRRADKKASKSKALPRRSFVSDLPDRGLFMIAAIVGFAVILFLRTRGTNAELVAGIAVAVMVFYGWASYRIPAIRMRVDRLGDNFYYLGFIYTLASLSAALFQLRAVNQAMLNETLGNFGIALITTIVGIAGRVLFVQMRTEIDDAEARVRQDLLDAAVALKGQLNAALTEFETFRIGVRQAVDEQVKSNIDSSANAAKSQIDRIADIAQSASSRIEAAFDAHETQGRRLREMIDGMAAPAEAAIRRLSETKLPIEDYRENLQSFVDELDRYGASLGELVDEVRQRVEEGRNRRHWWQFWRRRQ